MKNERRRRKDNMRRPLVCGVLAFVIGQLIGMKAVTAWGLAVAGVVYAIRKHRKEKTTTEGKSFFYCFLILLLVMGVFNGIRYDIRDSFISGLEERGRTERISMQVIGTVYRMEPKEDELLIEMKTDALIGTEGTYNKRYRIRVYLTDDTGDLRIGDTISCYARIMVPELPTNPGEFNRRIYYQARGITFTGYADSYVILEHKGAFFRQRLYRLRITLCEAYHHALEPEYAGVLSTMVLGMSDQISPELRSMYQRNGIAHILAISALHITILGSAIYRLLRKLSLPYFACAAPVLTILVGYGWMTGYSGSTIRAIIMFSMLLIGDILGRTYDMLTAAAISCLHMLIEYPARIYDAAFLLSFSAVLTLGFVVPACKNLLGNEHRCMNTLLSGILIQMITAPVVIHYYYEFPFYAWLLNLIVIPLMTPLLICGIVGALLSMAAPVIGGYVMMPCGWILTMYTWLCEHIERLPFAVLSIGEFPIWKIVLYYGLLLGIYEMIRHKHKLSVIVIIGFYIIVMWMTEPKGLQITMLDIGQGDSTLMKLPDHTMVLMDGGSSSRASIGQYVITPAVKYYGSNKIDAVFVSHMDEDHVNGIMELIEQSQKGGLKIGYLILPGIACTDSSFSPLIEAAEEVGIPVYLMQADEILKLGDVAFRCMYPTGNTGHFQDKNNNSMVIDVSYKEFDMLFTGDLEEEGEQLLLAEQDMEFYDVLKVGHHGSSGASSLGFLQTVHPKLALLSCGRGNRYGHPHAETLERLDAIGCELFRTDINGAILLITDGDKLSVDTYCR